MRNWESPPSQDTGNSEQLFLSLGLVQGARDFNNWTGPPQGGGQGALVMSLVVTDKPGRPMQGGEVQAATGSWRCSLAQQLAFSANRNKVLPCALGACQSICKRW